jgi:hypothetical protein
MLGTRENVIDITQKHAKQEVVWPKSCMINCERFGPCSGSKEGR